MISFNSEFGPFLLTAVEPRHHTDDEWRSLFDRLASASRESLRNGTYQVSISVTANAPTARERRLIAELYSATPAVVSDRVLVAYVVQANIAVRFVINALRWLAPGMIQITSVSSVDEALARARECLKNSGIAAEQAALDGARAWLHEHRRRLSSASASVAH